MTDAPPPPPMTFISAPSLCPTIFISFHLYFDIFFSPSSYSLRSRRQHAFIPSFEKRRRSYVIAHYKSILRFPYSFFLHLLVIYILWACGFSLFALRWNVLEAAVIPYSCILHFYRKSRLKNSLWNFLFQVFNFFYSLLFKGKRKIFFSGRLVPHRKFNRLEFFIGTVTRQRHETRCQSSGLCVRRTNRQRGNMNVIRNNALRLNPIMLFV